MMPYCFGLGFAMGLGHQKQKWRNEISSDWYERIALQTFADEQWVENFRMTWQTFNQRTNGPVNAHLRPAAYTV